MTTTKHKTKILLFILAFALFLSACSNSAGSGPIAIDGNGVATWEPVKGAVAYEYLIVDGNNATDGIALRTEEPAAEVPEGYCIHVWAVFENGETGEVMTSDYFGTPVSDENDNYDPDATGDPDGPVAIVNQVDGRYSVNLDDLLVYDVISAVNYDTLSTNDDGSISFEAAAPNGGVMRFVGTGVTVEAGLMTFAPGARLTALDAIGRICAIAASVSDFGDESNGLHFSGGYTFTDETSVASADDLFYVWGMSIQTKDSPESDPVPSTLMDFQPNFICFGGSDLNVDPFTVSKLEIYYDETTYNTGLRALTLSTDFYSTYLEGQQYDASREIYHSGEGIFTFYLAALPEAADEIDPLEADDFNWYDHMTRSLIDFDTDRYTIGDFKDADGNVVDKGSAVVTEGCSLEITIGSITLDLELPTVPRFEGAQTLHELIPYKNAEPDGTVTPLVVPIVWQDQPEQAADETLNAMRRSLGKIVDSSGKVTDYSEENCISLSDYYETVSYGRHHIHSYITDWYYAPYDFAEMQFANPSDRNINEEVYSWLLAAYPDMDWSRFDSDADGYIDLLVLYTTGESDDGSLIPASYEGAAHYAPSYTGETAGTADMPTIHNYTVVHCGFIGTKTLIHEYAHNFGIVDYYDVSYSGIDAVGSFDMQSSNVGDWNAYSKYAVGWIEPEVVRDLAPGESVDITIGAMSETGDAVVIPAAGAVFDGPFCEYIMVDLFTDSGINALDTEEYGLSGTTGVRIYHVNSHMEKHVEVGQDGTQYPIGTINVANVYNEEGKYLIELIQSGKDNTFTDLKNLYTQVKPSDFFYEGDVFAAEAYSEFFADGRMDNGMSFGYTIEIVSIDKDADGKPTATIRVTAS